jgi:steroid delta-isomerase-like uncharacterized protein
MSDELIALGRDEIAAFNAGDWDRMRGMLAPDCVYEELATQRRIEGPDAIVEANQGWKAAYPDAEGTVDDVFACGDRVVVQVTWQGTHRGPLTLPEGEIAATNKRVTIPACQVMRCADGKITELRQYFDMLGMLEQMGTVSADALAHAG